VGGHKSGKGPGFTEKKVLISLPLLHVCTPQQPWGMCGRREWKPSGTLALLALDS
jgi:hypothetical protein